MNLNFAPRISLRSVLLIAALAPGPAAVYLSAQEPGGAFQQVPPGPQPPAGLSGRTIEPKNAGGLVMLWIAPGVFTMGDVSNGPAHVVHLSRGYWLARTELTQAQWEAVMGSNPSKVRGPNRPVERVSWNDAMEFCRRLTANERAAGRLPPGYEYRLPTDAEWECACHGGTSDGYASEGALDQIGWYKPNASGMAHDVALKKPNAWGFFDMHGNVWEWCYDYYSPYSAGEATDPVVLRPDTGVKRGDQRINRGGAFLTLDVRFRFASRDKDSADVRNDDMGFRPALAPRLAGN